MYELNCLWVPANARADGHDSHRFHKFDQAVTLGGGNVRWILKGLMQRFGHQFRGE